jgi:Fe-S cluster assembly protein SufD
MSSSPDIKVSIGTRRRAVLSESDFSFTQNMVRVQGLEKFIVDFRMKAWENYRKLALPSLKDEAWRRTDLKGFNPQIYQLGTCSFNSPQLSPKKNKIKDESAGFITITDSGVDYYLSPEYMEAGVVLTDLETAEKKYPELIEKIIGKIVDSSVSKFAAMAAALSITGVFIYIPKNVVITKPFYSQVICGKENQAFFTHTMIYIDDNASLTHVHEHTSPRGSVGQFLHSGILELYVGSGSKLTFVELQNFNKSVWNFTHERARVDRDGSLDWVFGGIGSQVTKTFATIDLVGKGSSAKMSGYYFPEAQQHMDLDTQQNHLAPNTTSDLLFKGALLDESRSVWQGMIYVAPGSDKTDGYQENRNLILSPKARADAIPGLEILADDVRCTHGATVGKIDSNQLFYLISRGIGKKEAEQLLVEGFFDPIIQRIPLNSIRERVSKEISLKMNTA